MLPNKEYLLLMSETYQLNTVLKMIFEISIKVCFKQIPAFPPSNAVRSSFYATNKGTPIMLRCN